MGTTASSSSPPKPAIPKAQVSLNTTTSIKLGGASIFNPVQAVNTIPTPETLQKDIQICLQQVKEKLDRECEQGLLRVYVTVQPNDVDVTKLLLISKGYTIVGTQANQDNPELMDVAFRILK